MSRWHISSGGETQIKHNKTMHWGPEPSGPLDEVPLFGTLAFPSSGILKWGKPFLMEGQWKIDIFVGIFFVTPCNSRHTINLSIEDKNLQFQWFVSNLQNLLCLSVTFPLLPSSRHPPVTPATWKPLRTFGASWLSGGSVLQGGRWKFWRTSFSRRERMGDRGENVRRIVTCIRVSMVVFGMYIDG